MNTYDKETPEFWVTTEQPAYLIPDLHGDMKALLKCLDLTKCVTMSHSAKSAGETCHSSSQDSERNGEPLSSEHMASIKWVGKGARLFFLGDVLDNRRSADDDKFGVCGLKGTQYQILSILMYVAKQARAVGGDVVWVLGNHDLENCIST